MSIKLIALDLDGTLMLSDHITVGAKTKAALLSAHSKGIKIIISTGRTLSVVKRVISQLPFIDYVMYSDGAALYDVQNDKVIYEKLISFDITKDIIEFLNTCEVYYNVYLDGSIVTQSGRLRFYKNTDLPEEFVKDYMNNTAIYDDLLNDINGKSVELIVGFFENESEHQKAERFLKKYSDSLYITSAFRNEFEMTDSFATKGKTLEYLCGQLGITTDEVIAFGDSMNDLPLLSLSGISIAMGNAEEKLKDIADYVTDTNANEGVEKALKKYGISD